MEIATAKEVYCEYIVEVLWGDHVGTAKMCRMYYTTSIDAPNATISKRDDSITGMQFFNNKNIQYLPIEVSEKFPNLLIHDATLCSIKEISRINFEGLGKVYYVRLGHNQIEKITSETFIDLESLEMLDLRKKIKKLHSIN